MRWEKVKNTWHRKFCFISWLCFECNHYVWLESMWLNKETPPYRFCNVCYIDKILTQKAK